LCHFFVGVSVKPEGAVKRSFSHTLIKSVYYDYDYYDRSYYNYETLFTYIALFVILLILVVLQFIVYEN